MSRIALRHVSIFLLILATAATTNVLSFASTTTPTALPPPPAMVSIGDPSNTGHETSFDNSNPIRTPRLGEVAHPYRIAKREVSNAEYAVFLNSQATASDSYGLFDERMKITRTGIPGAWGYAATTGTENDGVAFVSRTNAARYCNYLTTGNVAHGPYKVEKRKWENGETHDTIVGFRDLTFLDEPRVYFLPDMHEFYKAARYSRSNDGISGDYQTITAATRTKPSPYGIENHASGLREWMDNKYRTGSTFALGASDSDTSPAALNATTSFQLREYLGSDKIGFRVAATAPLQIGDRLNRSNNFFWQNEETATLRIRYDDSPQNVKFRLVLRDFSNAQIYSRDIDKPLRRGVTEIAIQLPDKDGYYELAIHADHSLHGGLNGPGIRIPLAIMNTPMPAQGRDGNFGFTCHIIRDEQRFNFESFDFDLVRRLGVSQVRVGYEDSDLLRRIYDANMNPFPGIARTGLRTQEDLRRLKNENPALVEKWAHHGIPPEFAWHAEQVWLQVGAHKDIVRDVEYVNEPTYLDLLPEDYAQALKAAYIAAKLADPTCNFMAGDLNAIHAPVLQVNGGAFCDSVATHIYGFYVPFFWGIPGKMRELNGWMAAADISQKPIWVTEIGGCTYNARHMTPVRTLDEALRYQALHQPKTMAGSMAFGAAKVLPYNLRDVPVFDLESEFGVIDRTGLPKPAAMSFRTTALLLGKARFTGFLKNHSFKVGAIAGLLFKDQNQQDVAVLWRNDPYGHDGRFDIPFLDIIKPAQNVPLKSISTQAELFNMSGGRSVLQTKNGVLSIPVSEYPVFVRGRLAAGEGGELAEVITAHSVPPIELPRVRVKIVHNQKSRACDLMSGVRLDLTENTMAPVEVRIYNIEDRPVEGNLRLVPMSNWREWSWQVNPVSARISIPANGMGSAIFEIPTPQARDKNNQYYLNAIFSTGQGGEFRDTVVFRSVPRKIDVSDWVTYAKGYHLNPVDDQRAIRVSWDAQRPNYMSFHRRVLVPLADSAAALQEQEIIFPFEADGAGIRSISMLVRDRDNEVFQIKQFIRAKDKQPTSIRFDAASLLKPGVIIHSGGNGQIDFPVRLVGFTFDLTPVRDDGSILVRPYDVVSRSDSKKTKLPAKPTSGGGGAADMD